MKMPPLGLGAGPLGDERLDDEGAEAVVRAALDHGLTLFDTARSYGRSEERLGRFLAGAFAGPLDEATLARLLAAWDDSWPGMT
jgi:aryl-alcohol dehydrogenase-like predicted oxidoreductase